MTIIPTDAIKDPSPQLRAVLHWLDAMITTHNVEELAAILTEDYTHQVLPQSLGQPIRDRSDFLEYADTFLMRVIEDFKATIHEVVETPDKVMFHASSTATSSTGYPYTNEYNIITHVSQQPDGEYKVKLTKEFVDSKMATDFFPAERKRQEEAVAGKSAMTVITQ